MTASFATDADDYLRRAAQRDVAMFDALDRDKDGHLAIGEVRGNIDLEARFNDIDINRDGVITREELTRYIALRSTVGWQRAVWRRSAPEGSWTFTIGTRHHSASWYDR